MQELKEMRTDISFLKEGFHRMGLLLEDTNHKVDLILELLHGMGIQKVDRAEFETKLEQHEVRIQSLEAAVHSKSSSQSKV